MILFITSFLRNFATACTPTHGSGGGLLGFPTWYKYLGGEEIADKCSVVFDFPDDIGKILLAVVEILLRVAGMVAVGFVIYGGFQYMLSQGDKNVQGVPEKANAANASDITGTWGNCPPVISATMLKRLLTAA